ncbi:hypothetical protein Acr_10g0003200 [Actinidia rufa]|uniref:Uncharacterized protein n=1 Tax=Actinidia rufa TaxID=165716 RepID=A0A7J0F8C8_9ERIC|nr:hypothetical protein Acr_10g0003200 [Actinidia rufa]
MMTKKKVFLLKTGSHSGTKEPHHILSPYNGKQKDIPVVKLLGIQPDILASLKSGQMKPKPFSSTLKWWEKVHDYLIKAKDLLIQSTQTDPTKAKKGKGEQDETCQGIKPPTKNANDVKVMKGTLAKATDVVKTPTCHLPCIASKPLGKPAMFHNAVNKRAISQEREESSTSKEDCNWKRVPKKAKPSLIDNLGQNFFNGVPSASVLLEDLAEGLQLENFEMANVETVSTSEGSVGSVDGPNSFDLLTRRNKDPTVTKTLKLITTPELTTRERTSDIARIEASPKVPIMPACHVSSVISTFQGEEYIFECQRNYLRSLWKGTSQKIARHRLDLLNSFEEEIDKVMKEMERTNIVDVSPLKKLLSTFFQNIGHYNSTCSSFMEKMSREMKVESLEKAKHSVLDAEIEEGEMVKDIQALQKIVANIDREKAQLKKKLEDLRIRKEEAKSSLLEQEEKVLKLQANVLSLKEKVSAIEDAHVQSDEDTKYLEKMEELLETSRKELTNFKLFS